MPASFKFLHRDTSAIVIDCSENGFAVPASVMNKALYFHFKSRPTFKFLVDAAQSEEIMFISFAF